MQRVPAALTKPSFNAISLPLVPTSSVPHAESRVGVPTEWAWSEAAAPAALEPTTSTFAPLGYESGYQYPLLVWLHGDGASEVSLPAVMKHVSLRNFVAVSPRGVTALGVDGGYGWAADAESCSQAEDAVFAAVDAVSGMFSIHPNRVFLAGSGAGGSMAMRIALRHPKRFGGAATLDGPLPTGRQLLARVNETRQLPLLLSSTRDSVAYPEPQVCLDLSLLHSAGCRVAIRQYPGDDDLTTAMLADLNRWAMEIVCG